AIAFGPASGRLFFAAMPVREAVREIVHEAVQEAVAAMNRHCVLWVVLYVVSPQRLGCRGSTFAELQLTPCLLFCDEGHSFHIHSSHSLEPLRSRRSVPEKQAGCPHPAPAPRRPPSPKVNGA